ncbi:O-antigen ligase domain-containing protein [Duganella sp. BJB488]|nr:O-antigen ligase domain-containing protein [Duganella sp. BJB488]RFP30757.1 O-antigen ligase domain-containing protein [Duganella sp. BJB480]
MLVAGGLLLAVLFGLIGAVISGWFALLLFAPILPIIFVLRDFRLGVVLLMCLLPFQNSPIIPQFSGFNVINFMVLATLASLALSHFSRRTAYAQWPPVFYWCYLGPIAVGGAFGLLHLKGVPPVQELAAYLSPYLYLTNTLIKPLFTVLVAWMLGTAVLKSERPQLFLVPLVAAMVLPAFLIFAFVVRSGMSLQVLGSATSREVLGVLGMHANGFGQFFGIAFTVLLFLSPLAVRARDKLGLLFALGCVSLALMLTFSRGGYVVALVGAAAFVVIHRKFRYAAILLVAAVLLALVLPDAVVGRLLMGLSDSGPQPHMVPGKSDALTAGRLWLWRQLAPGFWHSPLWGNGVGSVAWSDPVKRGMFYVVHPHNVFLRALLDVGVLGFGALFLFFRAVVRGAYALSRGADTPPAMVALGQGVCAATVAMFIGDFAGGHYLAGPEQVILWLGIGMLMPSMAPLMRARQARRRRAALVEPIPEWPARVRPAPPAEAEAARVGGD